jgi:hypothetical protein
VDGVCERHVSARTTIGELLRRSGLVHVVEGGRLKYLSKHLDDSSSLASCGILPSNIGIPYDLDFDLPIVGVSEEWRVWNLVA